jgi:polyisoprenoid-binding protein YceI
MSVVETTPAVGTWRIDPVHSAVEFAVGHMGIATVRGRFTEFEGTLDATGAEPRLEGVVRAASISTDDEQRDGHLTSPDFFDVERQPEIRFSSTSFEGRGEQGIRVIGDFTLRGVTQQVSLDGELTSPGVDPWGAERVGVSLEGSIDRRVFGLVWNQPLPGGGFLVSDEVKLLLDFSLVKEG